MKNPPIAATKPHEFTIHGKKHVDPYWWLQDKTKPDVKAYLNAENDYAADFMRPHKSSQTSSTKKFIRASRKTIHRYRSKTARTITIRGPKRGCNTRSIAVAKARKAARR